MAAAGFPLWLSFCTAISTLTNNTANKGWRGVPETLALLAAGSALWVAIAGLRFSPEMAWSATALCIGGLSWYLLTVNNIGFVRNVQLRDTRETLKAREADLVTANDALQQNLMEIAGLQQQLAEQANRDPLTGLYNRRYLDSTLERELARCKREGQPISLILIDIDHFKKINDTYGHQAGDKVLQQLSAALAGMARAGDVACRYGGEEFLLLMPTMTLDTARERAEELRSSFGTTAVSFGEFDILTTLSIGISIYPGHGTSPDELIRSADRALYRAKHHGRNCTEVATSTLGHG
jgi:diguanylate cyclase (GGDEF)-like protein